MFTAEVIDKLKRKPSNGGCTIGIFNIETGEQVGSYERNYPFMNTFHAFKSNGKWYALYSKHYTATRVMSLPDCKDLGGEEPSSVGFCPVEYYVPNSEAIGEEEGQEGNISGSFGFIAGCVWGDDTSLKLQYLDLSNIKNGLIINHI